MIWLVVIFLQLWRYRLYEFFFCKNSVFKFFVMNMNFYNQKEDYLKNKGLKKKIINQNLFKVLELLKEERFRVDFFCFSGGIDLSILDRLMFFILRLFYQDKLFFFCFVVSFVV